MSTKQKIGFVTCVELGKSCLKEIYESGYKVDIAITLKDKNAQNKTGRAYIDDLCNENNTNLLKVDHINDKESLEFIKRHNLDILFVIGWSQLLSKKVIDSVKDIYGMHPTLLPMGRGRAAIPWTILKKLKYSGVSLFRIEEEVDSGALILQEKFKVDENINATDLYRLSKEAHVRLIKKALPILENSEMKEINQDPEKISYWPQRRPDDGFINLDGSIYEAELLIRAVTRPYPGAFFFEKGKKIIVWKSKVLKSKVNIRENQKVLRFSDGFLLLEDFVIE